MPQIAQQDWIRINVDFENSFQGNSIRDESVAAPLRRAVENGTIFDVLLVGPQPYFDNKTAEVKILGFSYAGETTGRIVFIQPHLDPALSFADFRLTEPSGDTPTPGPGPEMG